MREPLPKEVNRILKRFRIHLKADLGQNLLVSSEVLNFIPKAAELSSSDLVVEIGAGPGQLSSLLAAAAKKLTCLEIDQTFLPALAHALASYPNVQIVQGDALAIDPAGLYPSQPYKLVANLPYYITSPLLHHYLSSAHRPELLVVMVQKEVAQRVAAGPGQLSYLSVFVQFYGQPEILKVVPASAFLPPPEVDSAILRIRVYREIPWGIQDPDDFFRLVQAGFRHRRKQLRNALARETPLGLEEVKQVLAECDIDPTRRAQTLTLEEWIRLYRAYQVN